MTDGTGDQPISNYEDVIDSRDVEARIEFLRDQWAEATGQDPDDFALSEDDWQAGLSDEEAHEIVALMELADEARDYAPDWHYGEALIRDSYFVDYVQELLEDIGDLPRNMPSYVHIDWDATAREIQMDYTSVEFNGVTYWIR